MEDDEINDENKLRNDAEEHEEIMRRQWYKKSNSHSQSSRNRHNESKYGTVYDRW